MTDEQIRRAANVIRQGGLVAFPTETVYGLGANALDEAAVARIFERKGRPTTSPLIVHVGSVEMCRNEVVAGWPESAARLAAEYWPGPLTLVLPKRPRIPDIVTAGLDTVGVRIPDHPVALRLIQEAGVPLAAPSANRFTELSPTTAEHVRRAFGPELMVLDGGPCRVGIESTVVSLAGPEPVLLRPGMAAFDNIRQVSATEGAHPAPGMHVRHYSPRTRLVLYAGERPRLEGAVAWVTRESMPARPEDYAALLYATLHRLDGEGWDSIAVERPPETREWSAILDRLRRAAT